ncbi:hypothetical protein KU73_01550 [Pectobacterium wasabiae]|uniref:Uncharacterized protein n=1 Tax=Pectobacterium wasabiae TaxID=55208 RepID=A0AAW3EGE4_9GAMM|nr:hypothetical protein JV38_13925 [Pectobacterium wasabiae]KGA30622.1 hypothetical protein KU73_01550 [Pectobacterium wasabiae]
MLDIARQGVNLPQQVFTKTFHKYWFFDNDICTSDDLIYAVYSIIRECFDTHSKAAVFSYFESDYIGNLKMSDDWVLKINKYSAKMNESGDYGGLIIVDYDKQWALFQKNPVERGVLGVDEGGGLAAINELIYDNFIDCNVINGWLGEKTQRDKELVSYIGRAYLTQLMENYS